MKYYFLLSLLLLSITSARAQEPEIPPGTIKINDTLYIDEIPVANIMYLEFLMKVKNLWNYKLHDSLKKLSLSEIDRSLLSKNLDSTESAAIYKQILIAGNEDLSDDLTIQDYYKHPDYLYHPVLNVTKDQAELFCKWRTDMVKMRWSTLINDEGKKFLKKITYRLPTPEEYRLAKKRASENDRLLLMNEDDPLLMDMKPEWKNDNLIFYSIPEFTSSNSEFKAEEFAEQSAAASEQYTLFRCVCEVEP